MTAIIYSYEIKRLRMCVLTDESKRTNRFLTVFLPVRSPFEVIN